MPTSSTPDTQTDIEAAPDFAAFLVGVNKGRLVREAGEQLQTLVAAIRETGRGGSITVKLDIKPNSRTPGQMGTVQVVAAVAAKTPNLPKPESTFFIAEDNSLSRTPTDPSLF